MNDTPPTEETTPPEKDSSEDVAQRWATRGAWIFLLVVTVILTVADQWSKHWAHHSLRQDHGGSMVIARTEEAAFAFSYVRNHGAAWGFLANADESFRRPFFFIISLLAMGFILYLFSRVRLGQRMLALALALVLSGALGNFIDRVRFGYVVDFIDVRYGTFRWPTFNVADIAISVGVAFLLLESFFGNGKKKHPPSSEAQGEG
ncbi:MAG: signal peptidase II [Deltaproteobacteria bacterium]|nr:signal peptidase II [Deltaproteobacteria bacterium]